MSPISGLSPLPSNPTDDPTISPSGAVIQPVTTDVIVPSVSYGIMDYLNSISIPAAELSQLNWDIEKSRVNSMSSFYKALSSCVNASLEQLQSLQIALSSTYLTITSTNNSHIDTLNNTLTSFNSTTVPQDNAAISTMNQAISTYNSPVSTDAQATYNNALATYNTALATYNAIPPPISTDAQATYNNALATYNTALATYNAIAPNKLAAYNSAVSTYNSYVNTRNASTNVTNTQAAITLFNSQVATTNSDVNIFNQTNLTPYGLTPFSNQTNYSASPSLSTLQTLSSSSPPPSNINSSQSVIQATSTLTDPEETQLVVTYAITLALNNKSIAQKNLNDKTTYLDNLINFAARESKSTPPSFNNPTPSITIGGNSGSPDSGVGLNMLSMGQGNDYLLLASIDNALSITNMQKAISNIVNNPKFSIKLNSLSSNILSQLALKSGITASNVLINSRSNQAAEAATLSYQYAQDISQSIASGVTQQAIENLFNQMSPGSSGNSPLQSGITTSVELFQLLTAALVLSQGIQQPSLMGQLLSSLSGSESLNLPPTQNSFSTVMQDPKTLTHLNLALTNYLNNPSTTAAVIQAINNLDTNEISTSKELEDNIKKDLSGLKPPTANKAALFTASYIQAEITGGASLNNPISTLSKDVLINPFVQDNIVPKLSSTDTLRDFRDKLALALINAGTPATSALNIATLASVNNLPIPIGSQESIKNIVLNSTLNHTTTLGSINSQEIARQASSLITTLSGQINEALTNLAAIPNKSLAATLEQNVLAFINPNANLTTFTQKLLSPANTYIYCAKTGLSFERPIASNLPQPNPLLG